MNQSGYQAKLTHGGATPTRLTNVGFTIDHKTVDTSDLSHVIAQTARGVAELDVTGESRYKGQSGRNWTCVLGTYTGAELIGGSIDMSVQSIAGEDAADFLTQRIPGALTVTGTFKARYAGTMHFAKIVKAAASSATSLAVSITDATSSTVISGTARVGRGSLSFPADAAGQEATFQFLTVGKVGASFAMGSQCLTHCVAKSSSSISVKNPAGSTVCSGAGYIFGAGLTFDQAGAVTQTIRHSIHTITTLL